MNGFESTDQALNAWARWVDERVCNGLGYKTSRLTREAGGGFGSFSPDGVFEPRQLRTIDAIEVCINRHVSPSVKKVLNVWYRGIDPDRPGVIARTRDQQAALCGAATGEDLRYRKKKAVSELQVKLDWLCKSDYVSNSENY